VTPQEVAAVADRVLKDQAPAPAKRYRPAEDAAVCTDRYESKMSVSAPMFQIAIKDVAISIDPYERAKKRAQVSILCHMLFGKESDFFNELYDDNLIYTDLDYWFERNEAFSLISLSGESDDPNAVWSKLLSYLETQKENGLSRESFERYKRVAYADLLDIFDSTDSIANHAMEAIFDGFDLLELPNVLASVTYEEVCARFDEMFRKEYFAMGVISPYEKSEA
jgi:predicted Zn-dependent peptidase